MGVIGFEEQIGFKIKTSDRKKIKKIICKNQDKYYNESHFIRCAINQLITKETEQKIKPYTIYGEVKK